MAGKFINYPKDMKSTSIAIIIILSLSALASFTQTTDNPELGVLYKADQTDRTSEDIDWSVVSVNDSLREARIYELLDSNKVQTANDYSNAAMIFQHGRDSVAYGMAVKLMRKAIKLDSTKNKWLLAAAIDRELMSRNKPQIYGTQYITSPDGDMKLYKIDTTIISDEERIEYGVETLAQQIQKAIYMNKKPLSELMKDGKSIQQIVKFCRNEINKREQSEYNISEDGIITFGYELMYQEKLEDALVIFKLSTEFYPEAYNTWDSMGECLLEMNNTKEGIEAYKKSLELNPRNSNAKKIIEDQKKKIEH